MSQTTASVLFVCLGNICRSPTAQGVFETLLAKSPLAHQVRVDSAGTAAWHQGKAPDPRSRAVALSRGYDLEHLRARQVREEDFSQFDFILAMDGDNLRDLQQMAPESFQGELRLFLDYAYPNQRRHVPDPYYTDGDSGFHEVVDLIEAASQGLLTHLMQFK
ncbi:low molecular weight protein-tyrosine-phosphatase [Nitrincola tapanii]|uniref:protein-tyrosine-phosphatase n=1 Tax=Nitrincola tapanii TaxID=1708751 RepID=A0A5A9W564_9GAMM|nr:low molecular weight protein-tyrosine-phosphatase [Nitrincola tapanii]KAA0875792.1 low molecular weight phosphotyrosine protein phosphatase [Nitrincola tapanii]